MRLPRPRVLVMLIPCLLHGNLQTPLEAPLVNTGGNKRTYPEERPIGDAAAAAAGCLSRGFMDRSAGASRRTSLAPAARQESGGWPGW